MNLASLLDTARSRLFGYDIFISYTRADAQDYAARLHEQLTSLDYSCFIDRKEAPSGHSLNTSLIAALRRSQTFVLVATERALGREYVKLECGEFAATGRPIIPVNVDAALSPERLAEEPWSVIRERDLIWIDETADALRRALPSPEVYEGVQNLFQFTRRNVARRRWATLAAMLIVVAAVLAVWQARDARAQKRLADEQRVIVEQQTEQLRVKADELEKSTVDLRAQQDALEEKNRELRDKQTQLEAKSREASESAARARQQEALARESARRAEAQQQLAEAQQQIAEAQLARNQHLLYGSDINLAYGAFENRNMVRADELLNSHLPANEKPRQIDLRGFEWGYLRGLIPKQPLTLGEHSHIVSSVRFSPDGRTLARAGGDEIRLWDVDTQREAGSLRVPSETFYAVVFSPGGEALAAATGGAVYVWDARTLNVRATLKIVDSTFTSLAFSPDGKLLAVAGGAGVSLWEVEGWRELEPIPSPGVSVAFAPDSKTLAVGNQKVVRVWDTSTRKEVSAPLEAQSSVTAAVAFSPDGRLFAAAFRGGVKIWDRHTWEEKEFRPPLDHGGGVLSVSFSPDSQTFASTSTDGSAKLWDTATGRDLTLLPMRHGHYALSAAFSPDGKTLATGGADKAAKLWDISWRADQVPLPHPDIVFAVALSPDGRTLATGGNDSVVRLWDTASRRELRTLEGHTKSLASMAFSPDGRILATGGEDRHLKLWDTATWQPIKSLQLESSITSLAFSPDGRLLVACQKLRSPVLLDARTGAPLPTLRGDAEYAEFAAFSSDGKLATSGHSLRLWDASTGRQLAVLGETNTGPVAFSPDGRTLAVVTIETGKDASGETTEHAVALWDVPTGRPLGELKGHTASITSLAFTPDGRTLATGSYDDTVRLWQPDTQQDMGARSVGSTVTSLAFSRDGRALAIGVFDRTARLWRAAGD